MRFLKYIILAALIGLPSSVNAWWMNNASSAGHAAGGVVSYDLDAPWTGDNQTFAGAQVLDSAAEGVPTGSMTVFDDAGGTAKIDTNRLEITGSGVLNHTGVYLTTGIAKVSIAPPSGLLAALITPLWALTISLQIANPSPVPPAPDWVLSL